MLYEVQVITQKYEYSRNTTDRKEVIKMFKNEVNYNTDNPHKPVYIDLILWFNENDVRTVKTVTIQ